MNGATDVITPQQVFGADVETQADGSKHRLVRYPKAGYWVSYSRTAGDTPIISVTIQKLSADCSDLCASVNQVTRALFEGFNKAGIVRR